MSPFRKLEFVIMQKSLHDIFDKGKLFEIYSLSVSIR
jgi:hypothetical protein